MPTTLLIWLGKSLLPVPTILAPAAFFARSGMISGVGISHGKDDGILIHGPYHLLGKNTGSGYTDEDVDQSIRKLSGSVLRVCDLKHFLLGGVKIGPVCRYDSL